MKFNWYQLNAVNRNGVLPALGIIKFTEGGAVSSAHALQRQLASWPRAGAKQCSSAPPSHPIILGAAGPMLFIFFSTGSSWMSWCDRCGGVVVLFLFPDVGVYLLTGLL